MMMPKRHPEILLKNIVLVVILDGNFVTDKSNTDRMSF